MTEKTRNQLLDGTIRALRAGQVRQAVARCEELNRKWPEFSDGWAVGSQVALEIGNVDKALEFIERAISLQGERAYYQLLKAKCLLDIGSFERAIEIAEQGGEMGSSDAEVQNGIGSFFSLNCNDHARALPYYERAVELAPNSADYLYNLGATYRFNGRIDQAERAWDSAIRLNPTYYEAYLLRSELKTQSIDDNHIEQLESVVSKGISDWNDEVFVCFALGKEYEDIGKESESFTWLQRACMTRRRHMKYDLQADLATVDKLIETFPASHFRTGSAGHRTEEPIFIVGMPRTGTTLVERVLSSHKDVTSAGELNNFALQLVEFAQHSTKQNGIDRFRLIEISAELDAAELGLRYLQSTRPFTGKTKRFIDKLPLNFLYSGLIHKSLPQAKIVHVKRHPVDTCFAMYKRLFRQAYPMSYDLIELARYYVAYRQLMSHWQEVLPGAIHEIEYEQLVENQEHETRRLLEYCRLPWDDACLAFEKNTAASTTASATQVRQPIYTSSIRTWKRYETHLQPLIEVLNKAGIEI